ncbi:MAG: NifU family protein [Magnetovibrio sp.]|nr:NifU family protein [Magnetovibrio sp.]
MFIQTEATPNPATLKFLPGTQVMGSGTANFTDAASASNSPLALRLFDIDGIDGIFLGADFITVTKADEAAWDVIKPRVLAAVMDHFTQGLAVITETAAEESSDEDDSDAVKQIKELIETRVRPAVAQDGGDIVFRAFEEGVVYLHMQGACAGCPSSTATLKNGIENMLRHYVPEVVEVRAVN